MIKAADVNPLWLIFFGVYRCFSSMFPCRKIRVIKRSLIGVVALLLQFFLPNVLAYEIIIISSFYENTTYGSQACNASFPSSNPCDAASTERYYTYRVYVATPENGGATSFSTHGIVCPPNSTYYESCTDYRFYYSTSGCPSGYGVDPSSGECLPQFFVSSSDSRSSCNKEGNPCDVITGRKTEIARDTKIQSLDFIRYYDSGAADPGATIGAHWRHSFDTRFDLQLPVQMFRYRTSASTSASNLQSESYDTRAEACINGWGDIKSSYRRGSLAAATTSFNANGVCEVTDDNGVVATLAVVQRGQGLYATNAQDISVEPLATHTVTRPNGAYYTFEEVAPDQFEEVNGYPVRLERDGQSWLFYDIDNTIDRYETGKFISRTLGNGQELVIDYDSTGKLETVTESLANTLRFTYNNNGQIATLVHPAGQINYGYDANFNLVSVTYEDGSVRQYHYEDINFPHHLTGITDENGVRYATWTYDSQGRAVTSQHAGSADITTFTYNPTSTVVTDAAGGTREYHIVTEGRTLKVSHVTGDKCSDCYRGGMQNLTYGANGFLASSTDWKGNVTNYIHNAKGQELSRTEAVGTPQERTITTEWHVTFNLPTKITEPERETIITYDANGNELSRVINDISSP